MTPNGVPYEIYDKNHTNDRMSTPNGFLPYSTQSINRMTPNGVASYNTLPMNRAMPNGDGYNQQSNHVKHTNGEVVYIPVRVEETGQLMNRSSAKKQKNPVSFSSHYVTNGHQPNDQPRTNGFNHSSSTFNRPGKSSYYGNDVEDALKRFDYLNDYSADEGSRSSRFTGVN